jgi:hypothetical protein
MNDERSIFIIIMKGDYVKGSAVRNKNLFKVHKYLNDFLFQQF